MRNSKLLSYSVPFLLIPALILYPQVEVPAITIQAPETSSFSMDALQIQAQYNSIFTYDDVLDLLEELEEGELEKRCSPDELHRINHFLALLARNGVLPNEANESLRLEDDIQDLLGAESSSAGFSYSSYLANFNPASTAIYYYDGTGVFLCKSWIHKKWDKTKKFVKHHKKAILIGVAIVVAATIVICSIVAAGAAGAAAGAAASSGSDKKEVEELEVNEDANWSDSSQPEIQGNTPNLSKALEEQISSFKEMVVEEGLLSISEDSKIRGEPSFGEKTRELGAFLAHETLNGISELASFIPQLGEEIKEIGSKIVPENFLQPSDNFRFTPEENYDALIASGHQKIDQLFSTDQAERYSMESNQGQNSYVIGMIPPPGLLSECLPTAGHVGRIAATQATAVRGWAIGQPINNRTTFGTVPTWSTVRRRYWKNQAFLHSEKYEATELERMKGGLAPQRKNKISGVIESKELHHDPSQKDGGLFDFVEVWPEEHALIDKYRKLGN